MASNVRDRAVVDSLYRISSLVSDTEDPREALEIIIDQMMQVLPAQSAAIELLNPDTNRLETEVFRGHRNDVREVPYRLGHSVAEWVTLHGEPLLVPDIKADSRYLSVKPGIRSEMAVPMIGQEGTVIGVVNVDSIQADAFEERDLKILTLLTNEASRVVNRIWMIKKLKEKAGQLEALIKTGQSIVKKREIDELLASLAREAQILMGCRVCAVFLLDESGEHLHLKATSGATVDDLAAETLALPESAIGTAVLRRKTIEVQDLKRTEEHHFVGLIQRESLVSMLVCPIIYEDEVIGVLNAYTDHHHRFDNEERRIFQTIARLGASGIQNARLYGRIFQTEESLRQNERLTTLGLLSAEIAHEIRNPLTVIRLLFEGLGLEFDGNDMRAKDVEIIGEKIDQLEAIVSRVLSFGKSREDLRMRYELSALVADTLHLVRLKLQQSRIELVHDVGAEGGAKVEVCKGQIQQAILNLVINAMQAMPDGGRIEVCHGREQREGLPIATLTLKDTGRGIPPPLRGQIFNSFLSGHSEGTGLGLAIVKRVLNSHGGDVELLETSEAGTTMRLWLPLDSHHEGS